MESAPPWQIILSLPTLITTTIEHVGHEPLHGILAAMATRAGGGGGGEATPSPKRSKLAWVEGKADVDVSTFLVRHRPSVTRSVAGGDGWIWVVSNRNSDARNGSGRGSSPGQSETKQINRVVERAAETLHALLERFDAIEVRRDLVGWQHATWRRPRRSLAR